MNFADLVQIVSATPTDTLLQKQIIQLRWGVPYGTRIPVAERKKGAKTPVVSADILITSLQIEIARRMNLKKAAVNNVLVKYWNVSAGIAFADELKNGFEYPRRRYNVGPRNLTDEGREFLMDFENLKEYGAVSLEGRSAMVENNFA